MIKHVIHPLMNYILEYTRNSAVEVDEGKLWHTSDPCPAFFLPTPGRRQFRGAGMGERIVWVSRMAWPTGHAWVSDVASKPLIFSRVSSPRHLFLDGWSAVPGKGQQHRAPCRLVSQS